MPKARKKANPKNMKKTTSRGAYKKARKKQMVIQGPQLLKVKKTKDLNGPVKHIYLPQAAVILPGLIT